MKPWNRKVLGAVCAIVAPFVAVVALYVSYDRLVPPAHLPAPPSEVCFPPKPVMTVSAGDSRVDLRWRLDADEQLPIKGWRYQQFVRGGRGSIERDTGSAEMFHAVGGLVNGVTYMFRVRAISESGQLGCWSRAMPALPAHLGDALKRMEEQLKAIGKQVAKIVKILKAKGENGRPCKTCTRGERGPPGDPGPPGPPGEPATPIPCTSTPLGTLLFYHDSPEIDKETTNKEQFDEIVEKLEGLDGGLVLTVGYATSVGFARHNAHLSDRRAACVSLCLQDRIERPDPEPREFEYREIARGEVPEATDPPGTRDESRRVDVLYCEDRSRQESVTHAESPIGVTLEECRCP